MKKKHISWEQVQNRINGILIERGTKVYGVPKGGMIVASILKEYFCDEITLVFNPAEATLIVDDIVDSGKTRDQYITKYPDTEFFALYEAHPDYWMVFPWESDHPAGEESVEDNIVRILEYLGENPNREGLLDTPKRVVKSWKELYAGYNKDPKDLLTVFDSDGYDQIVLLKDIEMHSQCEHHMLPFYGKAHVAYIPDKKVIGISKLARLVDMYSRRLQIQERIGEQVTDALMKHLKPKGAACVIEARHMCMCARGVGKQHSIMSTSSIKGVFMEKAHAKQELMALIK